MASVVTKTAWANMKPKRGAGIAPEVVARRIEQAVSSRHPKPRRIVGAQARQILSLRAVLPTGLGTASSPPSSSRPAPADRFWWLISRPRSGFAPEGVKG